MLGIKRIDHICMVVSKIDERLPMLTDLFGMRVLSRFPNAQAGYNGVALQIPGSGCEWEVLEPTGDHSFIAQFLDERGPGLHHVTFQVESVERATKALREYGCEPLAGRSHGSYKEVFIHPRDSGGVLFQLYEGGWGESEA